MELFRQQDQRQTRFGDDSDHGRNVRAIVGRDQRPRREAGPAGVAMAHGELNQQVAGIAAAANPNQHDGSDDEVEVLAVRAAPAVVLNVDNGVGEVGALNNRAAFGAAARNDVEPVYDGRDVHMQMQLALQMEEGNEGMEVMLVENPFGQSSIGTYALL